MHLNLKNLLITVAATIIFIVVITVIPYSAYLIAGLGVGSFLMQVFPWIEYSHNT